MSWSKAIIPVAICAASVGAAYVTGSPSYLWALLLIPVFLVRARIDETAQFIAAHKTVADVADGIDQPPS